MENSIKMLKTKVVGNISENKIYISLKRKSKNIMQFYYNRVRDLIYNYNYKEIYICGLGACVNYAIKLALYCKDLIPALEIANISTKTITHFDEFINENDKQRIATSNERKSNYIEILLNINSK